MSGEREGVDVGTLRARVSVHRTRYPWSPSVGRWMWRRLTVNECSAWHYDVDDWGFGDDYADVLRRALDHAAIEHVPDLRAALDGAPAAGEGES